MNQLINYLMQSQIREEPRDQLSFEAAFNLNYFDYHTKMTS